MELTADEARALRALRKLTGEEKKLGKAAGEVEKKTRKAASTQDRAFGQKAQSDLTGMAVGLASVGTAVGAVTAAFSMFNQEMQQTAQVSKSVIGEMQAGIAGAGDIAQFDRIERNLRFMAGAEHLGMRERAAIRGGVRGALPTAGMQQIAEITQQAIRSTLISGDVQTGVQFGGVAGEVSKLMPEAGLGDISDITLFTQQAMGRFGRQLDRRAFGGVQQLAALGMDPQQAIAFLLASAQQAQGAGALTTLASFLAQRQGAGADLGDLGMEDIQRLIETAPTTVQPAVRALVQGAQAQDFVGMIQGAREQDLFERQISAARRSPTIRGRLSLLRAEAAESIAEFDDRQEAMEHEAALSFMNAQRRAQGNSAFTRWVAGTIFKARRFTGDTVEQALRGAGADESELQLFRDAIQDGAQAGIEQGALHPQESPLGNPSGDPGDQ